MSLRNHSPEESDLNIRSRLVKRIALPLALAASVVGVGAAQPARQADAAVVVGVGFGGPGYAVHAAYVAPGPYYRPYRVWHPYGYYRPYPVAVWRPYYAPVYYGWAHPYYHHVYPIYHPGYGRRW